jgi:hypothetical protein
VIVEERRYDTRGFPIASTNVVWLPRPTAPAEKEGIDSGQCLENLRALGVASQSFARDNADVMPASFLEIADTLDSAEILVCPSDPLRPTAASLPELQASNITYRIVAPGISANVSPSQAFLSCPIHGHHGDTDGAVVTGTNRYPPRLVLGHPLSATVEPGQPVELAVLTGDPALGPFRYQWRRLRPFDAAGEPFTNTVLLADVTNRTHRISAASAADEGYYDVMVHDSQGRYQVSHLAYLRVEPLVTTGFDSTWEAAACMNNLRQIHRATGLFFTHHQAEWPQTPVQLTNYLGWPLSLYCPSDTNRAAPATWEAETFADLSYALEAHLPADPGTRILATCRVHHYQVRLDGEMTLGEIAPAILVHPTSQATFSGRALSLGSSALGDELRYQWFREDAPLGGQTNTLLLVPGPSVTNTANFHVVVTNSWGSATSHVAVVAVNPVPQTRLSGTWSSAGTELIVSLAGPPGIACRLEGSPDLQSWSVLGQSVLGDGVFVFLQRPRELPAVRFYRASFR